MDDCIDEIVRNRWDPLSHIVID
ncbi:hypothetical protein SBA4_2040014 [Candidatus Sulfopaludibacter sp. SbA4]|nr:hypothetical protein SBA4_2040014 [Candidatus Sulfopaludibacter sp. SbA4]